MSTDFDTTLIIGDQLLCVGEALRIVLLHCHQFELMRSDLFPQLTILGLDINELDSDPLCNLPMFGSRALNVSENRIIIEATKRYLILRK